MVFKRVQIKNLIKKIIKQFPIPIRSVYLFGSYAYGKPNKFSDIDLAFISDKFKRKNSIKRIKTLLKFIYKTKPSVDVDIEPLGFTPEEIKKASKWDITGEIKEKGIKIYG